MKSWLVGVAILTVLMGFAMGQTEPAKPGTESPAQPEHVKAGTASAPETESMKSETDSPAQAAIAAVLQSQVDAWNRGDLKGFMDGYWRSPELVFAAGMQETHGWERVYKRYQTRYQSGGSEMGKLAMAWIKPIHLVTNDIAYVDGEYRLTMKDGSNPHGVFTLIFRKFPEGWRIVHDRTCAEH